MIDKSLQAGSTSMLILKLIEKEDLYGYEMIETLAKLSNSTFALKAGTLYPLLRRLEDEGLVTSYEKETDSARIRKYYHLTQKGQRQLEAKKSEWKTFSLAINRVLNGGADIVTIS
jgi:PadR family transcriptional regulator, regulatory protein PadR